ncbi:NrfD/PsrC family molybdoenzyme membrane anchor subunit [Rhodobaculum claviforme]|uniref:Tetrathionate reductase n=1 Tax=Rhodobaculum claviforme TaxID=1549854 RepID=A0A934TLA2_9RHOB|nr:NrfD/PsrC family molybdoenzyme membrane anchor subunit [Rhodobaculum claviforme]MBK5928219.1 tetrathionate reductase [Rhodobaculum claviforme]
MHGIELLAPQYAVAWYPWAVQYFFLIALSYGALWLALPGVVLGRARWMPTARLALLAAASTALVAPVTLLADLHQPLRAWHFYAHPTPSSWMSIGSIVLPLHVAAVLALAWLVWRAPLAGAARRAGVAGRLARLVRAGDWDGPRWLVPVVGGLAVAVSLPVALYTGAEVAVIRARPLWHTEYLPVMLVATGIVGAAGLVVVLNRATGLRDRITDAQMLAVIAGALVLAGLVAVGWLAQGLAMSRGGSVATALEAVRADPHWRALALWGLAAGAGLFAAAAGLRVAGRDMGWLSGLILGLVALHVAWMFRWTVLMEVQTVARNSAGAQDYVLALGSQGLLGIIGSFGLWLAVVLIVNLFIPWRAALPVPHPTGDTRHG